MGGVRRAIVRRPDLWIEAARSAVAFAPKGWWRTFPPLPIPERGYMAWRRFTAYGDPDRGLSGADVVAFLEWRRRVRMSL